MRKDQKNVNMATIPLITAGKNILSQNGVFEILHKLTQNLMTELFDSLT